MLNIHCENYINSPVVLQEICDSSQYTKTGEERQADKNNQVQWRVTLIKTIQSWRMLAPGCIKERGHVCKFTRD